MSNVGDEQEAVCMPKIELPRLTLWFKLSSVTKHTQTNNINNNVVFAICRFDQGIFLRPFLLFRGSVSVWPQLLVKRKTLTQHSYSSADSRRVPTWPHLFTVVVGQPPNHWYVMNKCNNKYYHRCRIARKHIFGISTRSDTHWVVKIQTIIKGLFVCFFFI